MKNSNAARTLQYQVLYIMPKYGGFCPKEQLIRVQLHSTTSKSKPQALSHLLAVHSCSLPYDSWAIPAKKAGKKAGSCCCSQFSGSFECPVRDAAGGEEPSPAHAASSQHPAHPPQARTEHLHHGQTPVLWAGFPLCTLSHRPGDSAALPVITDTLETQKVY